MYGRMKAHLLFVPAVLAGCTDALPDIEGEQTITQGIYGQLANGCDTPDCEAAAADGIPVFLMSSRPTADTQTFDDAVVSNARGLFELSVEPGTRVLCRGYYNDYSTEQRYYFGPCIELEVPVGTTRRDWFSGPGGGQWYPGENFDVPVP